MQELPKWRAQRQPRRPTLRERFDRRARAVSPEAFADAFTFSLVRNSWSRAHSWYRNVIRDAGHRAWYGVDADTTFPEFVAAHLGKEGSRPQLHWLRDRRGEIPLDFIGRFENYEADVAHIMDRLGLTGRTVPHLMADDDKDGDYTEAYDDECRQTVADFYAEEIDHFGFTFGE